MSRYTLLIINGAILTGCAVFIYPARTTVITALLLLLPLLDRSWRMPDLASQLTQSRLVLATLCLYGLIVATNPDMAYSAMSILLLVALPEEWFFRAYVMARIESFFIYRNTRHAHAGWLANITTSALFSLMHLPTQGLFGLSIFFPSLVFGRVYQMQKNLALVIALHALSNLLFILYIHNAIEYITFNYIP